MCLANFQRFALSVHAVAFVDVVNTASEPHATVTAVSLNSVDCFSCGVAFHALGGNLPTALVGDGLARFES